MVSRDVIQGEQTGPDAPSADTAAEPQSTERPEYIPEKFWDADAGKVRTEDLAKSYAELERGRSKADTNEPADKAALDVREAPQVDASTGLAEAFKEFAEAGAVSSERYEALGKIGLDKTVVDNFVQGSASRLQAQRNDAYEVVGGKENYTAMAAWAASNMSDAEKVAYNDAVNSGDVARAKLAVQGLHSRWVSNVGQEGQTLEGDQPPGNTGVKMFANRTQHIEATQDPRYSRDPAFREEVDTMLAASIKAGKI